MDKLERDLAFFTQQLERERDPFMRIVLLGQIQNIKEQIFNLRRREVEQLRRENQNLQDAIDAAMKRKKK